MPSVNSRQALIDYCLRRLGFPVIEINIDQDQIDDRIDDAIQYWQDYHFDGLQKIYYIKTITQTEIANKYVNLSNVRDAANNALDIVGVTRIFPINDADALLVMDDIFRN